MINRNFFRNIKSAATIESFAQPVAKAVQVHAASKIAASSLHARIRAMQATPEALPIVA